MIKIIDERIKKAGYNRTYSASVIAVNGNLADIQLIGSSITIPDVKNKSGETLVVGDEIKITSYNNDFNDIAITVKK